MHIYANAHENGSYKKGVMEHMKVKSKLSLLANVSNLSMQVKVYTKGIILRIIFRM